MKKQQKVQKKAQQKIEKSVWDSLDLPQGKRTKLYRFFEILPGFTSYMILLLLVIFSLISPVLGSYYLLFIIATTLVKAVGITFRTVQGYQASKASEKVDWHQRFLDLYDPHAAYEKYHRKKSTEFGFDKHVRNLKMLATGRDLVVSEKMLDENGKVLKVEFPKPGDIYHAVIMVAYNEGLETLIPTVEAVKNTTFDNKKIILVFGYEERGGEAMKENAKQLYEKFKDDFYAFIPVMHPKDLKGEIQGKGPNLDYAAEELAKFLRKEKIDFANVIATSLDSDNKMHKSYLDNVAYEFVVHPNRQHLSYQPVSLFTNNIWETPAPMRIIAVSNSFFNIISSMRVHTLKNFASHSQPFLALSNMGYWSKLTIVEDGHQYWRSLDVAYVGVRTFSKDRLERTGMKFWPLFVKFARLLEGHVTLASISPMVAFGGWVPKLLNASSKELLTFNLPNTISYVQLFASIGLMATILLSFGMLPKRPAHIKKPKIFMLLQWLLMPVVAIIYQSFTAFYSQTRLMVGNYMEKFDVTKKVVKK